MKIGGAHVVVHVRRPRYLGQIFMYLYTFSLPINYKVFNCVPKLTFQGMTAARIPFSAARNGQMPKFLSMINLNYLTPAPAVMLNGFLASLMVVPNDFDSLINYFSFCMWIFHTSTCAAVIIFRYKMPIKKFPRAFQVPIFIPIVICIIGTYLVLVPFILEFQKLFIESEESFDFGYIFVFIWILLGIAIYVPLEKFDCEWLVLQTMKTTKKLQIFFQVVPAE